jgi:hypothetical protein
MFITFNHCGDTIIAKVLATKIKPDWIILFPENKNEELGFSLMLYKRDDIWICDNHLQEKFPHTFSSLLLSLKEFEFSHKS